MLSSGLRFLQTAKASDAFRPTPWTWRDGLALTVLAGFIAGLAVNYLAITNDTFMTIYQFAMPGLLTVALIVAYGRLLAEHWALFRVHLFRNLLTVIVFVIALHVILLLVRLPFGHLFTRGSLTARASAFEIGPSSGGGVIVLVLLASIGPMLVAVVEDTVFRHTLLAKIPVWTGTPLVATAVVIVNSMAFGAIHFWAFGGSIPATVPYMVLGLIMNLVYLWTKNLWFVLGTHIIFNSMALPSTIVLAVLSLFGLL